MALLRIQCYANDANGDEAFAAIPIDFSGVGYEAGSSIPWIPAVLKVEAMEGDNTALLQAAIDQVAKLPMQENGFRGAIELAPGFFMVDGQLKLKASGIVIRGSNQPETPTFLLANGSTRRSFLVIEGTGIETAGKPIRVIADAKAGAIALKLESLEGIRVGSRLQVTRPSTEQWIQTLGTDAYENAGSFANLRVFWSPGSRDLVWDRRVVEVDENACAVILDAPITTALSMCWGGGIVEVVAEEPNQLITNVGIEHLTLLSAFDGARPMEEEHAWFGIVMDCAEDIWVHDVEFHHFVGSAIRVGPRARRVSLLNCSSAEPISELGGTRRWTYWIEGQQVWIDHCTADSGLNDFTAGQLAGGPIVFHACTAENALGSSGTFESWASGVLYENVEIRGADLRVTQDWNRTQGAGWTAGNSVVWNCKAKQIVVSGHDSAPNVAVTSDHSLFASQRARQGLGVEPVFEYKPDVAKEAYTQPFVFNETEVAGVEEYKGTTPALQIVNGRFVIDGKTVWGGFVDEKWWRGQTLPAIAEQLGQRCITRFCPGREGPGLTERLDEMAEAYHEKGDRVFYGGVGLWYDRRRDDHLLVARNSEVWAPFFEMPWARTGKGQAFDGLSLFDLGTYNPWFFDRTRAFSMELAKRGMLHMHYLYNTHNVLETLAHYVDYPWRPANCINDVGLEEPPPLDVNHTVHLANVFYNVDHEGRKELHRSYILHTLDQLADAETLVVTLGTQFAGPLAFQKFFIETVTAWEYENGKDVKLMLETSKDITDAILSDPIYSCQVDVVSMRYWQILADGSLWAPRGDQNLAFREMNTLQFGKMTDHPPATTPQAIYRQVREYHDRFPELALVVWHGGVGSVPGLMAGAANVMGLYRPLGMPAEAIPQQPDLDAFVRKEIGSWLMQMNPVDGVVEEPENNWCLADEARSHVLIYSQDGENITFLHGSLHNENFLSGKWFQPETGEFRAWNGERSGSTVCKPDKRDWLLWLHR